LPEGELAEDVKADRKSKRPLSYCGVTTPHVSSTPTEALIRLLGVGGRCKVFAIFNEGLFQSFKVKCLKKTEKLNGILNPSVWFYSYFLYWGLLVYHCFIKVLNLAKDQKSY